ncbi:flagellar hook-basal body complex protein FliE [Hoeflea sp. YIM 152468]|uniref:flagellar hook-basal body complex protein FliE n=1 Tax=Hoeflea sp. YIM 152468 TaxID=3031759 RepID=UPI0023DB2F88|nr:flagellar hook-basal body complex protein FliE [Hoeflea sp. YIM 152468]MDF1608855.1 flagellar hook-basal body complex protein FliE [Hoeflea sp. YIM 152468]
MINMMGGVSALSGLSGSRSADLASAAAMPQLPGASGMPVTASFAETMKTMGEDAVNNLRVAEGQSLAAVRGEVPTRDVVDAIMSAEQTLQTAVAIRDKLVTAYLEIARMQI